MPHERPPILGLREAYRPAPGPGTGVMPLLIVAVLAALAIFYFRSKPAPTEVATASSSTPADAGEQPEPSAPVPASPAAAPVPDRLPSPHPVVAEKDFTPWMSPLALDTYLRQKNRGQQGSFWSRGNWIRAIEGRWHNGGREFRIALGTMARPGEIDWQYRLDLTQAAFAEEFTRFGGQGYTLVQSQAYRSGDGSLRYQAVWWREDTAEVAGR